MRVGLARGAAFELPLGDQGFEIWVNASEVVVGGGHRSRVDTLALRSEQGVQALAAAGTDPQRRAADQ